jgi:hypothetical protein
MPLAVLFAALAAPPDPTAGAGPLPVELRWTAIAAVARVTPGEFAGPVAAAVCVGRRGKDLYLLTASHAYPRADARKFEFFTRESYPEPADSVVGSEVVVRLDGCDVALVKATVGEKPPSILGVAEVGKRPKKFPVKAVSVGCPDGSPPVFRTETLTGKKLVRRERVEPAFFWETAAAPVGGMSGGPLLDTNGRIVGLCTAASAERGYFAHLDEIQAGLKQGGFGWLFEPTSEKSAP